MSKVLCIPDIHCRKFWRQSVASNSDKVDRVIFLGDYLDLYQNELEENPETMECDKFRDSYNILKMLNDIVYLKKNNPDKYILLTGNHTDSYIWPKFSAASRTDYVNYEKYHKFFLENLDYFNLVWIEGNIVFSHAGISEEWGQKVWRTLTSIDSYSLLGVTSLLQNTSLKNFGNKYINLISDISRYRGGNMLYGSCEWADIREHIDMQKSIYDIVPLGDEDMYQVFGHTQVKEPLITDKWACLDCRKGFIIDTITNKIEEC